MQEGKAVSYKYLTKQRASTQAQFWRIIWPHQGLRKHMENIIEKDFNNEHEMVRGWRRRRLNVVQMTCKASPQHLCSEYQHPATPEQWKLPLQHIPSSGNWSPLGTVPTQMKHKWWIPAKEGHVLMPFLLLLLLLLLLWHWWKEQYLQDQELCHLCNTCSSLPCAILH